MRPALRTIYLSLLALSGFTATAQNSVTVRGQVTPCNGLSYPVHIFSDPGTTPIVDTVFSTGAGCSYLYTFHPTNTTGGISVGILCGGGLPGGVEDSMVYNATPVDTLVMNLSCGGGPAICQAAFSVQQAMGGGALIPWQITTTNQSTGPAPIIYSWSMPDGSVSTAAQPTFGFPQPGVYGICLTISAGTCSSVVCDTVVVDSMGYISTQPVWYDCVGTLWGSALIGTPCDDGNPITSNDTWGANCICAGTICEPPVITAPSGALTICSNDSLVLQAITTGTGPMTYSWTGPGTFNDTAQTVFIHDAAPGTYHITVANACGTAGSDIQVALTTAPDAGISADTSLCAATAPVLLLSLLNGTPESGVWSVSGAPHSPFYDPAVDGPGVYVYTVVGMAPCPNASATVTITGTVTWYGDADGDSFGDPNVTLQSCTQPAGYVGNANDLCPFIFGTVNSACDDGDPFTFNDQLNANCTCIGTDSTFVDCLGIPGGTNLPGTACSDPMTGPGTWNANCTCVPDSSTTTCSADFWVIQAYDSTSTGVEPIPNEVWVWNLSSGGNGTYQFLWNFGDGTTSTDAYPTHEYTSAGPWNLCLTIASGLCTDMYCDSVSVDANGILNQLVIGGGNGNVAHETTTGARSGGFTLNVIQQITSGISENPAFAELKAWPNPVLNELNISFNTSVSGTVPVTVTDPTGRAVIAGTQQLITGSNTLRIPTTTLEPGLYMVRIGNDARSITQRFLKVR